jgi:hypothetical protein
MKPLARLTVFLLLIGFLASAITTCDAIAATFAPLVAPVSATTAPALETAPQAAATLSKGEVHAFASPNTRLGLPFHNLVTLTRTRWALVGEGAIQLCQEIAVGMVLVLNLVFVTYMIGSWERAVKVCRAMWVLGWLIYGVILTFACHGHVVKFAARFTSQPRIDLVEAMRQATPVAPSTIPTGVSPAAASTPSPSIMIHNGFYPSTLVFSLLVAITLSFLLAWAILGKADVAQTTTARTPQRL